MILKGENQSTAPLPHCTPQILESVQWNLDLSFFKGTEKTNECGKTINPGNYYTL